MERCTTFLKHLTASHFSATYTATDLNLDTLCTYTHSVSNGHLDSSTITYATFNLTSDRISYDMRVNFWFLNFVDIDLNVLLSYLLKLFFKFIYFGATLSDNKSWACSIDSYSNKLKCPLNNDLRDRGLSKTIVKIFTNFKIFCDFLRIISTTPVRVPTTCDTDTVADRISFLSHIICSLLVV